MKPVLRDYQEQIARDLVLRKQAAVFVDPGFGKTLCVLSALDRMKSAGRKPVVLLVGPINVIETTWPDEIAKWGYDLSFQVIRGTEPERHRRLACEADIYMINFELLPWLFAQGVRNMPFLNPRREKILVVDESTYLKDPGTFRWKALKKKLTRFDKRIIMTGTPRAVSSLDLWTQIGILDLGERLGRRFTAFREEFFSQGHKHYIWKTRPDSEARIQALIADLVLRLPSGVKLFEAPLEVDRYFTMAPDEQAMYDQMEEEAILELMTDEDGLPVVATAESAGILHNKLSQMSHGFIYADETKAVRKIHTKKYDYIEKLVEELNGKSLIVVYKFQQDITELRNRFGPDFETLNDGPIAKQIQKWNAGKLKVLGLHPRSGGLGLNLQAGGHHMVILSPIYSAESYKQVVARLARGGQEQTVTVHRLFTRGTVDMTIQNNLDSRLDHLAALLDYVENRYKSLLFTR